MAQDETKNKEQTALMVSNKSAPGIDYYQPLTEPSPGSALSSKYYPQNSTLPCLFKTIKIKDFEFKNRAWVSPMCQYSCESGTGKLSDWHLVHLGSLARGGAGLVMIEASSVLPNGMISPEDSGIWSDEQIEPLKRVVDFIHSQGAMAGIQLAHAGRKASTYAPWLTDGLVTPGECQNLDSMIVPDKFHGWKDSVVGPSPIPFDNHHATPRELTEEEISKVKAAFAESAHRAHQAGIDVLEIHGAHGYLIHSFCSPLSNHRQDRYGGSLDNRIRLPLEVIESVKEKWPKEKPLFYRISATDWYPGGEKATNGNGYLSWGIEQSVYLSKKLSEVGVDLIDVSSGGCDPSQDIPIGPGYQVPLASHIKQALPDLLVAAVGLLTTGPQIEQVLQKGSADVAFLAREFLRDINFVYTAAKDLGVVVATPVQYQRAFTRMYAKQK